MLSEPVGGPADVDVDALRWPEHATISHEKAHINTESAGYFLYCLFANYT